MLPISDRARAALEDSHIAGYRVSAFYGPDQTEADVPVTADGSLTFSASGQIQASGKVFLARDGESMVPTLRTDSLAPFGQELQIDRTVTVGDQTWTIPLGRFRITRVPSAKEYFRRFPSQARVVGWAVQLDLKDRFDLLLGDDFLAATGPTPGATTWDELRRISSIPVLPSLPDKALPSGIVYESRMKAIEALMAHLGGVPHLTRQGALTARKADTWLTETVPKFTIKGVIDIDDGLSNDLYNSVVVTTNADPSIVGRAEITAPSDPLAVTSPLGRRVYRAQNPLVTSQEQADATAATMLARLSTRQAKVAKVTCLPRPDIELGDFGQVVDPESGRTILGEVSELSFSMDPFAPMTLSLIVAETL